MRSKRLINRYHKQLITNPIIWRRLAAAVLIIALMPVADGCAPFAPNAREPGDPLLPSAFSAPPQQWEPERRWWEAFNDPQLSDLIQEALGHNLSLEQSWARLRQARALAVGSGAALYPELDLDAGASSERRYTDTTETVESYSLGMAGSYEIDLWGRIRSERQAARLSAAASREDLNTAAITLSANIATRWIGIISQRMQQQLLVQQLDANQILLELVELRFRKSLASAVDVFQQRQVVEQTRAQLPLVEQSERRLLNELALLLGRTPFSPPQIQARTFEIPADPPAAGIPAQLLANRPDVRAAARRLEAADWNVAAARADRLPRIGLSVEAAYQADELSLLFDNWLTRLAANMTAPLFDGRRRTSEVQRLQAVAEENLAAYRQTVLTAVREVEDALVDEAKLREHLKGLEAQLAAASNALDEARRRYRNGLSDYLPVLTQLLIVQGLERTQIQRRADLLTARVALYRSLGGTWTDALTRKPVGPIAR
jgi:outer membrane protein, multidrug efflux system